MQRNIFEITDGILKNDPFKITNEIDIKLYFNSTRALLLSNTFWILDYIMKRNKTKKNTQRSV